MKSDLKPTTLSNQRVALLDVFRGFAIWGIFMVNILVMNVSFVYRVDWEAEQIGALQQGTLWVLETFFYSKFFTIFSFLFGAGLAMQLQRVKQQQLAASSFFVRRLGLLLGFGVIHIVCVWSGDILHLYALLGVLLLLVFRLPAKALLWVAGFVFVFPFYRFFFESLMEWLAVDPEQYLAVLSRTDIIELKRQGSYFSSITLRLKEWAFASGFLYAGIAPMAFTAMLLGGYVVKKEYLFNLPQFLERNRKPFLITLGALLIYRFVLLYGIVPNLELSPGSPASIAFVTVYQLSDIAIAFGLLWGLLLLFQSSLLRKAIFQLSYVGRLALTNYLLQSVVGFAVMRLLQGYETFSPVTCVLLVTGVFLLQIVLSKWWLRHFQFGPLEWAWRCFSYARCFSIKRKP